MYECSKCGLVTESEKSFCRKCGAPIIDPEECLHSASLQVRNGDHAKGIDTLRKISRSSVFRKKRDLALAELYIKSNQIDDGRDLLNGLFSVRESLDPRELEALISLFVSCGKEFTAQDSLEDAERCYESAYALAGRTNENIEAELLTTALAKANRHIDVGELVEADAILISLPQGIRSETVISKLADTHFRLGSSLMQVNKPHEAYRHFARARELQPMNETYSQPMSDAGEAMRRSDKKKKTRLTIALAAIAATAALAIFLYLFFSGFIVVDTNLPATVNFTSPNGSIVSGAKSNVDLGGLTHFKTGRLRAGLYEVRIEKKGYETATEKMVVGRNRETILSVKLMPAYGSLGIKTKPEGAIITVDGKEYGVSPASIDSLQAVAHRVILVKSFFKPETINVNVERNGREEISVNMKQYDGEWIVDFGTVTKIEGHPANVRFRAAIKQDGRRISFNPVERYFLWDSSWGEGECNLLDNYAFSFRLRGSSEYYQVSGSIEEDGKEIRGNWVWADEGLGERCGPTSGKLKMIRVGAESKKP